MLRHTHYKVRRPRLPHRLRIPQNRPSGAWGTTRRCMEATAGPWPCMRPALPCRACGAVRRRGPVQPIAAASDRDARGRFPPVRRLLPPQGRRCGMETRPRASQRHQGARIPLPARAAWRACRRGPPFPVHSACVWYGMVEPRRAVWEPSPGFQTRAVCRGGDRPAPTPCQHPARS